MLQLIVPDLLEHPPAESVFRSFCVLEIEFSLSRLVIEGHLQGIQTVFFFYHASSLNLSPNSGFVLFILSQFLPSIKKSVEGLFSIRAGSGKEESFHACFVQIGYDDKDIFFRMEVFFRDPEHFFPRDGLDEGRVPFRIIEA